MYGSISLRDVVLLIGPSQVGKTTIQNKLLAMSNSPFERVVTRTTREPRKGETDGDDYYFTDRSRFEILARNGHLVEYNEYSNNLYGTERAEYARIGNLEKVALQVVDVNGARAINKWCNNHNVECTSLFITPPSLGVIENRVKGMADAEERVRLAALEMSSAYEFSHTFVNKKLAVCVNQIVSFLDQKGIFYV